jgi:Retinal pigment epithelial membrane protein
LAIASVHASKAQFSIATVQLPLCCYLFGFLQIHCVPRPGKDGFKRPVYTAPSAFSFHHVNAFEADSATIVIDTFARKRITFDGSLSKADVKDVAGPEQLTSLRRLVVRGTAPEARAFDVGAAFCRTMELPSQLPANVTGRPHSVIYAVVRCFLMMRSASPCHLAIPRFCSVGALGLTLSHCHRATWSSVSLQASYCTLSLPVFHASRHGHFPTLSSTSSQFILLVIVPRTSQCWQLNTR